MTPSPSLSLSFILLLGKQCFWHLVWWVMSLPDACSCLFGYFIGPDDSLFPLHMPHRLPQKPAGPDWSNVDDLRVRMHHSRPASTGESPLKPADPLSLNKVPAMCSFVILWPFNDIPFKPMKLFANWFWNELMQTALFVQMVNCLSGVKVTSVVVGSFIYVHTGQSMQLYNTHTLHIITGLSQLSCFQCFSHQLFSLPQSHCVLF